MYNDTQCRNTVHIKNWGDDSMSEARISFRVDSGLKDRAEDIFELIGINMSTALTMFLKAVSRTGGLPFEAKETYPGEAAIQRARQQIERGECYRFKTIEEADAFAKAELSRRGELNE